MFALSTRLVFNDYTIIGDVAEYDAFIKKCKEYDISRLFDTTKGTVLLWDNRLFVAGIPTNRKDTIGTPIRYTLLFDGNDVEKMFSYFIEIIQKKSTILGDFLDKILQIAPTSSEFFIPREKEKLKNSIRELLTQTIVSTQSVPQYSSTWRLWSEFCPTSSSSEILQNFIDSLKNFLDIELSFAQFSQRIFKKTPKKARLPFFKKYTTLQNHKKLLFLLLIAFPIFYFTWPINEEKAHSPLISNDTLKTTTSSVGTPTPTPVKHDHSGTGKIKDSTDKNNTADKDSPQILTGDKEFKDPHSIQLKKNAETVVQNESESNQAALDKSTEQTKPGQVYAWKFQLAVSQPQKRAHNMIWKLALKKIPSFVIINKDNATGKQTYQVLTEFYGTENDKKKQCEKIKKLNIGDNIKLISKELLS